MANPSSKSCAHQQRVKFWVFAHHVQVAAHCLPHSDGIVNGDDCAGQKFLRVEVTEVVVLPTFVGIEEDEIERTFQSRDNFCGRRLPEKSLGGQDLLASGFPSPVSPRSGSISIVVK
jgi:hypothetical protein